MQDESLWHRLSYNALQWQASRCKGYPVTFNQRVDGSNPSGLTNKTKDLGRDDGVTKRAGVTPGVTADPNGGRRLRPQNPLIFHKRGGICCPDAGACVGENVAKLLLLLNVFLLPIFSGCGPSPLPSKYRDALRRGLRNALGLV